MMTFWVLAIGLGIAAFAFVCLPAYFYRQPVEGESTGTSLDDPSGSIRTGVNVSIYQEREAEYKETLDQNLISQDEYTQLINELKRNLIQEAGEDNDPSAANPALGRLPLVLAVLVPLFAVFAYSEFGFSWGSIDDVQVMEELRASDPRDKIAMRASIEKLADRMKGQPDNWEGWFLLAQSYQNLGINEEAAAAYRHLITKFPRDPGLSSYYTETLYLADDRNMTPRVEEAMERTLSLNPADATMLEIKAMSLYQKGELRASVTEFRKALATG